MNKLPNRLGLALRAFWTIILNRRHSFADDKIVSIHGNSYDIQNNINNITQVFNDAAMVEKKFKELTDLLK